MTVCDKERVFQVKYLLQESACTDSCLNWATLWLKGKNSLEFFGEEFVGTLASSKFFGIKVEVSENSISEDL